MELIVILKGLLQKVMTCTCEEDFTAQVKSLCVRKRNVLQALKFLKKYNHGYHDIIAHPRALNWIDCEEGGVNGNTIDKDNAGTKLNANPMTGDMCPIPRPSLHATESGDEVATSCFVGVLHNLESYEPQTIQHCIYFGHGT
jgi:hypothetical protein